MFEFYAAWLAVIFPLVYSPGPGNILCAVSGAANGARKSAPFILGLNVSYASWSLALGFGMGAFVRQYPEAFYYAQLAGCAYIFYLAVAFLGKKAAAGGGAPKLKFMDGVVSQALNVKGVSIVALMYSQFLSADSPAAPQVFKLTAMLASLNLFTHFTWALGGSWMMSRLASERAVKIQNKFYAAMLIAVAIWLLPDGFLN